MVENPWCGGDLEFHSEGDDMGGRASRAKGNRVEREIVHAFQDLGIPAERVPLSGAAGGSYSGDIIINNQLRAEVKARKEGTGFSLLYRWLADNDMLIVKQDRHQPLVVMPVEKLAAFFKDHQPEADAASSW